MEAAQVINKPVRSAPAIGVQATIEPKVFMREILAWGARRRHRDHIIEDSMPQVFIVIFVWLQRGARSQVGLMGSFRSEFAPPHVVFLFV